MTMLQIATGRVTKADFPVHRTLNSKSILVDTDGGVWVFSGAPASHGLKPADDGELAALEGCFGKHWRNAVAAMKKLDD